MAELFRIKCKSCWDNHDDPAWFIDSQGNELCTLHQLQKNVEIPDETKRFDVVGFQHPANNRFKAIVQEDDTGLYLKIPFVMGCNDLFTEFVFPDVAEFNKGNEVDTLLKKLKKKMGDVVYLQIEY